MGRREGAEHDSGRTTITNEHKDQHQGKRKELEIIKNESDSEKKREGGRERKREQEKDLQK